MELEQIKELLNSELEVNHLVVKMDGNHLLVVAVSDMFDSMKPLEKQKYVLKPLSKLISDGTVHAVTVKTFNLTQWKRESILY